jgi:hypothetical protein
MIRVRYLRVTGTVLHETRGVGGTRGFYPIPKPINLKMCPNDTVHNVRIFHPHPEIEYLNDQNKKVSKKTKPQPVADTH